jgi:hypothetical protein
MNEVTEFYLFTKILLQNYTAEFRVCIVYLNSIMEHKF